MSPDYIVGNWSDELLNLMIEKRNERLTPDADDGYVSEDELLREMDIEVNKESE